MYAQRRRGSVLNGDAAICTIFKTLWICGEQVIIEYLRRIPTNTYANANPLWPGIYSIIVLWKGLFSHMGTIKPCLAEYKMFW